MQGGERERKREKVWRKIKGNPNWLAKGSWSTYRKSVRRGKLKGEKRIKSIKKSTIYRTNRIIIIKVGKRSE